MTAAFSTAKSLLFVPGDRGERIPKALSSAAHAVIVDLEDAVAPPSKTDARHQVSEFVHANPQARILLRLNASASPWFEEDLALAAHPAIAGIVLPKANRTSLDKVAQHSQAPIWPLVETAEGIQTIADIARFPRVERILLGTIDLALDLDIDVTLAGGKHMLDIARFDVVSASMAAGIAAPVDGVFPDLADIDGLRATTSHSRACGFGGMM